MLFIESINHFINANKRLHWTQQVDLESPLSFLAMIQLTIETVTNRKVVIPYHSSL